MTDDVQRAAIALYDRFTHEGGMDRRALMTGLTRIAGGSAAAAMLLSSIACTASEPQVAPDDPRIRAGDSRWEAAPGRVYHLYDAVPANASATTPLVIVIHENRGLNDYVRDVARRVAVAGFAAAAPDLLSPAGGTPADEDRAREMIGALDMAQVTTDGAAMIRALGANGGHRRRVGIVGFCWGGGMVDRLAVAAGSDLSAGVAFYGPAPDPADAARVEAPLLLHFAGLDTRLDARGAAWAAALRAAHKDVTAITYPGVDHAFHNDTSAARYNREAAEQAWATTIAFFRRHLDGRT
jgi:carboxymethylenebutenolidase